MKVTAGVNSSARSPRQKVNAFVPSEISDMMRAGEPALIVVGRLCWRVPVILSLTSRGDVGEVGAIDVDVETGRMQVTPQLVAEIETRAKGLAIFYSSR